MTKDTSKNNAPNPPVSGTPPMTLRQWYAGLAMQALITKDKFRVGMDESHWTDQCRRSAFLMADAMIAEGSK